MENDLISRSALKRELNRNCVSLCNEKQTLWCEHCCPHNEFEDLIDNAPTIEPKRPQGEREFIEILTNYPPDDLCTYPEYRGKPYYSIHYRENGEEFVGYGTYKIEVLSDYLRVYFFGYGV